MPNHSHLLILLVFKKKFQPMNTSYMIDDTRISIGHDFRGDVSINSTPSKFNIFHQDADFCTFGLFGDDTPLGEVTNVQAQLSSALISNRAKADDFHNEYNNVPMQLDSKVLFKVKANVLQGLSLQDWSFFKDWVCHWSIPTILISNVHLISAKGYSRLCELISNEKHQITVWILCSFDQWSLWDNLRSILGENDRLRVCLFLSDKVNSESIDICQQWLGEIVECISFDLGLLNRLIAAPGEYLKLLSGFTRYRPSCWMISQSSELAESELSEHFDFLRGFLPTSKVVDEVYENATQGYDDMLQIPLQPLKDNLNTATYNTFLSDPVKYKLYEEAIALFFSDYKKAQAGSSDGRDYGACNVMVAGAGSRGPLVQCVLDAAKKTDMIDQIDILVVEKNKCAFLTLKMVCETNELWSWLTGANRLRLLRSDMRDLNLPDDYKVDLVVSELLGSFGDNELSPECIAPVENLLRVSSDCTIQGAMIPQSYDSFISPISSAYIRAQINYLEKTNNNFTDCWEMPYVVKLVKAFYPFETELAWQFTHPDKNQSKAVESMERYSSLEFEFNNSKKNIQHLRIDGFVGYFESVLYKSQLDPSAQVTMSTRPSSHTAGMFSWFPLLLPLKKSITIRDGDSITLNLSRRVDNHETKRVWYEWFAQVSSQQLKTLETTCLHNKYGSTYSIGL